MTFRGLVVQGRENTPAFTNAASFVGSFVNPTELWRIWNCSAVSPCTNTLYTGFHMYLHTVCNFREWICMQHTIVMSQLCMHHTVHILLLYIQCTPHIFFNCAEYHACMLSILYRGCTNYSIFYRFSSSPAIQADFAIVNLFSSYESWFMTLISYNLKNMIHVSLMSVWLLVSCSIFCSLPPPTLVGLTRQQ